ncbi:hypothetical protein EV127DRAFT_407823 [Xylaria flabelliformis]|nr:hypothetical protein EV127DRAFT_407823 [Xylaria flabelliformis]
MSMDQPPEVELDEATKEHIRTFITTESPENPLSLYLRNDQGVPLVDLVLEIRRVWSQLRPLPRFVILERNDDAAAISERRLKLQAGPDVDVRWLHDGSDPNAQDGFKDKQIIINTASEFLQQELGRDSESSQGFVIVMHDIAPPATTWDRVWIAGLSAWMDRASLKSVIRCFITSKGPLIRTTMPGGFEHVAVQSAPQPSINHIYFDQGIREDRIKGAVTSTIKVYQQDPNARVAFFLDPAKKADVLSIIHATWEETSLAKRSNPQTGASSGQEGVDPGTMEEPKMLIVDDEDGLYCAISQIESSKEPFQLVVTMNIEKLDACQLGLSSLVVFEPIEKVSQSLAPTCKMECTSDHLSSREIGICQNLLGEGSKEPQQSFVRCVLAEGQTGHAQFLYPDNMMALLFLAIGFGVVSPLASQSAIVDDCTKPTVLVFLRRLIDMHAIIELDEDCRPFPKSLSGSCQNRRFKLGMNPAPSVFEYMVREGEIDFNYAWLSVSVEQLGHPSSCEDLDFSLAISRLTAAINPARRFSPILFTNARVDIDTVIRAAADDLPKELSDWEEKGIIWYAILLIDHAERRGIQLNPDLPDFQPTPEVSKGLFVDAKRLGDMRLDAMTVERRLRIRGPLFDDAINRPSREYIETIYSRLVRAVVDAYPHNLIMLFSKDERDPDACFALDLASHVTHRVNVRSLHGARLAKGRFDYHPRMAVYLTLRSFNAEILNTVVEDLLILPSKIVQELENTPKMAGIWKGADIRL